MKGGGLITRRGRRINIMGNEYSSQFRGVRVIAFADSC